MPTFPPFVETETNPGPQWSKWLARFERLMVVLDVKDNKRKRAMLLHYAGPKVDEIFDTLSNTGTEDEYEKAVDALNAYFQPKANPMYEVYVFRQAKQESGETLDHFVTRLRQLSKNCDFADVDKEITAQIIMHCKSQVLRRRALSKGADLSLQKLLDCGRALEASEKQAGVLEGESVNALEQKDTEKAQDTQEVNATRGRVPNKQTNYRGRYRQRSQSQKSKGRQRQNTHNQPKNSTSTPCYFCGGNYPHQRSCPAKGKECIACHKIGHFAKVCKSAARSSKVNQVYRKERDDSEPPEYTFSMCAATQGDDYDTRQLSRGMTELDVHGYKMTILIDSGTTVNIMDAPTFHELKKHKQVKVNRATTRIYPYGSEEPLPMIGVIDVEVKSVNGKTAKTQFHVVKSRNGNLLSLKTAEELKLITIHNIRTKGMTSKQITEKYKSLFEPGIGKVKGKEIKLHIDEDVKPKQQRHRRIPFHTRKDVEKELERLEKMDIIEKIDGPTPWISPIVVVPKPSGEVRICVDMRQANTAIKRERHPMPTLDELIDDMNGATLFSTLDLTAGYHQFELEESCRYITTFSTHLGLRRYKRLMFGVNAASEIIQAAVAEILSGLSGVKNMSDDIIVYGNTTEDHNANLNAVLERLESHGVKLNQDKCQFACQEVKFYGHIFSKKGLSPDPKKVEALVNAEPPKNAKEVKSLLGLATYISRFIPDYSTITTPLRKLTHKDEKWKWEKEEADAFQKLKEAMANTKTMPYFDPRIQTELIVDASPSGLGAMLCQNNQPIAYASKTLTDTETRYSQTEREMLAVVWGMEHFHLYLYGAQFKVVTDHKPLLRIFEKQTPMSARIERWRLRMMPYNCTLVYKPGKDEENPADYLSRHPREERKPTRAYSDNQYINYVQNNAVPKTMTLDDIREATSKDDTLQMVMTAIETNNWKKPELKSYKHCRDEFAVHDGMILRGTRLVLPEVLKAKALDIAHRSHQGIVKTKAMLREKVWFPGIDKMIEDKIKTCIPCQASQSDGAEKPEPLRMTELPNGPWKEVSVDFLGPLPSGEYLFVAIDEYSRYPEVEIVSTTSAKATIPKLDAIFARQGIPEILKSDNGPPFSGHEFEQFATHLGFKHRKVTPYWPRANGSVERFNRCLVKVVRTAHTENKNWRQQLYNFLRMYRATPHTTTNISPSKALNGREMKCELPQVELGEGETDEQKRMKSRDRDQKRKMKDHADQHLHGRESYLKEGDTVLVRQPKRSKESSPFDPKPFTIVHKRGNTIVAKRGSQTIRRNISFFKKVNVSVDNSDIRDDTDDFDDDPPDDEREANLPPRPILRDDSRPRRNPRMPVRFRDFVMSTML